MQTNAKQVSLLRIHGLRILLAVACGACAAAPNPFEQALGDRGEIQIDVTNVNFSDATLWLVVPPTRRIHLGTVTGKNDAVFTVPWSVSGPFYIEIDLLAGPRCSTDSIIADPGDVIELQIRVDLADTPECART